MSDRTCAITYCREPALNDHRHSLCREHHPAADDLDGRQATL